MKKFYKFFLFLSIINVSIANDDYDDSSNDENLSEENYNKTWIYFSNGDDLPEIAYLTEPPSPRILGNGDIIQFEFYSRENMTIPTVVLFTARKKRSTFDPSVIDNFDSNLDTKIIVHGWKSSSQSDTVQTIKNEYLKKDSYNIIAVNWREQAANNYYLEPVRYTRHVGTAISKLINYLVEKKKANPQRIHLIGHSLGAHTVGFAGSYSKYRIARITGLDPAAPCFEYGCNAGAEGRLDQTDADFVDVIHSCAGILGFYNTVGHIDFYPNKGSAPQPGCAGIKAVMTACSHGRSHRFFAESINSKTGFYGYPCKSWDEFKSGKCLNQKPIIMGDRTPTDSRGIYYLQTKADFPFALGEKGKKKN